MNSWHWLGLSLLISIALSSYHWNQVSEHVEDNITPKLIRQEQHLVDLRMLTEGQVEQLNQQTLNINGNCDRMLVKVDETGIQPIPTGTEAIFDIKNEFDKALVKQGLYVEESGVNVQLTMMPSKSAKSVTPKRIDAKTRTQNAMDAYNLEDMLKEINKVTDKTFRKEAIAAEHRRAKKVEAYRKEKAKREAEDLKRQQTKGNVSNRAIAVQPKAGSLPFKTEEIPYIIVGDFQNMFLFLVQQSLIKPSYHLKDIKAERAWDDGMRLSFILQVNYQ